jgi:hypothetical protein
MYHNSCMLNCLKLEIHRYNIYKCSPYLTETLSLVGFQVLTAVVMKCTVFWNITSCSPLSVNRRFGGTYRLHLQGQKNKLSKKPACKQVASRIIRQLEIRVYIDQQPTFFGDNLLCFLSPIGSLVEPMRVGGFILSYGRASGNRVPLFHLPSASYVNPDFWPSGHEPLTGLDTKTDWPTKCRS